MKRISLALIFLLAFCGQALARPLVMLSTINPNGYAAPILIYSNENVDVYIPDDMINFNLFNTKYPQNGNFSFSVYFEVKDDNLRKETIYNLKKRIENKTVNIIGNPDPNLLAGSIQNMFFDMQNMQAITTKEIFVDRNGNLIGTREGFKEIIPLNDKHPLFLKIAENAADILDRAKKDPGSHYLLDN